MTTFIWAPSLLLYISFPLFSTLISLTVIIYSTLFFTLTLFTSTLPLILSSDILGLWKHHIQPYTMTWYCALFTLPWRISSSFVFPFNWISLASSQASHLFFTSNYIELVGAEERLGIVSESLAGVCGASLPSYRERTAALWIHNTGHRRFCISCYLLAFHS